MHTGSVIIPNRISRDTSPHLVAKEHEDLASMVEMQLRHAFQRANLWVLPYDDIDEDRNTIPALMVIDGATIETPDDSPAVQLVQKIYPLFYGEHEVHVGARHTTVETEGSGLKDVVEHLLNLRYGHRNYSVDYELIDYDGQSVVMVEIDDLESDEGNSISNDVITYIFDKSRELRPDVSFVLFTDVMPRDEPAHFAPGFTPV